MTDQPVLPLALEELPKISRGARYYRLHREERIIKSKEYYNSHPDVIAKREERERIKAEKAALKEAERAAKEAEKVRKRQERLEFAKRTSHACAKS